MFQIYVLQLPFSPYMAAVKNVIYFAANFTLMKTVNFHPILKLHRHHAFSFKIHGDLLIRKASLLTKLIFKTDARFMKYLGHCVQTSFNKDTTKCMFALHDNHIIMFPQTTLLMMYQKLV